LSVDGSGSPWKFADVLAELSFGLLFADLGAQVALLRDNEFLPAAYCPDLLVTFTSGLEMLVDVVRMSSGSSPIGDALREALGRQALA
jgi:hypothetical protein